MGSVFLCGFGDDDFPYAHVLGHAVREEDAVRHLRRRQPAVDAFLPDVVVFLMASSEVWERSAVSTTPGAMVMNRTLCDAASFRRLSVMAWTANLVPQYTEWFT